MTSLGSGAATGGFVGAAFGIVGAIAVWWVAAGFGVRLGVTPDDFAASAKKLLGFGVDYDVPPEPTHLRHPADGCGS